MNVIRGIESLKAPLAGSLVTLGNFDGVHRGHQHLLSRVKSLQSGQEPVVVMTFDPHPVQVLYPDREFRRLMDQDELAAQLSLSGVDVLIIEPFTQSFAQLSPSAFIESRIIKYLAPQAIVVGYDFAFGKDRVGDFNALAGICSQKSIRCDQVMPLRLNGDVVSSRGIRDFLGQGRLHEANDWLGRNFALRGSVVHGAGRGAGLGFATLNVEATTNALPKEGVYATLAHVKDGIFASVTNIGSAPTFTPHGPVRIECHVLDANVNVYGEKVKIEFVERLRDEIKFPSVDALKDQITIDVNNARRILREKAVEVDRSR